MSVETEDLPSIRLSPDYGAPSPLWYDNDELVSTDLLARLIRWQRIGFNFHWEAGWTSDEAKVRWAEQASVLEADLRLELQGKAELTVEPFGR